MSTTAVRRLQLHEEKQDSWTDTKDKHNAIREKRHEEARPKQLQNQQRHERPTGCGGVRWSEDVLTFVELEFWTCSGCYGTWIVKCVNAMPSRKRGQTEVGAPGAWGGVPHRWVHDWNGDLVEVRIDDEKIAQVWFICGEGQDDVSKFCFNRFRYVWIHSCTSVD